MVSCAKPGSEDYVRSEKESALNRAGKRPEQHIVNAEVNVTASDYSCACHEDHWYGLDETIELSLRKEQPRMGMYLRLVNTPR